MEIELKLLVAPEHLVRIARHPALKDLRRRVRRKQPLHSVYFDTPDFALEREGVALRLRQNGARWIQTLKGEGGAAAGLHVREELEWEVAGDAVDLAALAGTRYQKLFAQPDVRDRLAPVFATRFDRAARMLAFPDGSTAELAIDCGEIRVGARRAPVSEVEIELKAGDPQRLFELARRIAQDVPLRLGHASKAERGYALVRGRGSAPQRARAVRLDGSLSAGAALRRIALACVAHMQANEDGMLEGHDPEYLHQLRVGLRRLRSCLALVELAIGKDRLPPLADELRWLQNALGPARDWDVFVTETLPPLLHQYRETEGLTGFRMRCARLRRLHAEAARAAIRSQRYTLLLLAVGELFARDDLGGLGSALTAPAAPAAPIAPAAPERGAEQDRDERPKLDSPVADFAAWVLDQRHRRLRKRGGGAASATPEVRHAVRIAAKKLRYAAEFFAPLYSPRRTERYVAALQRLQDILGALNDAVVVDRLLAEVVAGGKTPIAPFAEGLMRGWTAAVTARELARYGTVWRRLEKAKPFWR